MKMLTATPEFELPRASVATALIAVLLREFRAALMNRYVHVFCILAICGGVAAVILAEEPGAATVFIVQIVLFFVSLMAVLVGVSSARAEADEWPILCSQPAPRWVPVVGKFASALMIFAGALAVLFAPAFVTAPSSAGLVTLYLESLALTAVFGSLGLCAGYLAGDRVQGLIASVSVWLCLLFGFDLVALFAAQWPIVQRAPDAWVGVLMLNPLDAFRIQALFALEQIPPETANKTPLAQWWLEHAGMWMAALSAIWTVALLSVTIRAFKRMEV